MSHDKSGHKFVVYKNYLFSIFNSIEEAHIAYCSAIADYIELNLFPVPFIYRINNIVIEHSEDNYVPISNLENVDEICAAFNIEYKNEYISVETNNYLKEMKIDFSKMISYFENDNNYEVTKIKYGDVTTAVFDSGVYRYLIGYVISSKDIESYLLVKEFADDKTYIDKDLFTLDEWLMYRLEDESNGIIYYDNHLISSDNTIWLQRIINLHSKGYF